MNRKSVVGGAMMGFALLGGIATNAQAQAIFSPTGATVNSGGSNDVGGIAWTFDQSGLSTNFVSGVTNFDTYIASNPLHGFGYFPNEWFSLFGNTSAVVTYDFGSVKSIDRFALWNEETAGIGLLNILGSTDGATFSSILSGLTPPDHPVVDYPATVYSFGPTNARYFRMEMSQCPQPNGGANFNGCAIGEVAFRSAAGAIVTPEPSSIALTAVGLLALAGFARRRRNA